MSLNKPSGSDVAKVTSYLCVCKMSSFLAFFDVTSNVSFLRGSNTQLRDVTAGPFTAGPLPDVTPLQSTAGPTPEHHGRTRSRGPSHSFWVPIRCHVNALLQSARLKLLVFGCSVHVFPARLRGYGTTPLVSRTVVPTAVVSSTKTPCQQAETLVMWHVYWAFGRALIIGQRKLPADRSGGLTRPQNVSLCCKKQELDNSVLGNTVHNFMGCSWFCERGVLAFRKADTSNSSATENA